MLSTINLNSYFCTVITVILLSIYSPSYAISEGSSELDGELHDLIQQLKLTNNPASDIDIPDIQSPIAQLGMKLFYSKTLGGDQTTACVTCHHPMLGGGDGLSLPIGVDSQDPDILGPGRRTQSNSWVKVPRNAPTTFNIALWKKHMFHDGRVKKLDAHAIHTPDVALDTADALGGENLVQAQARFPITSPEEMRGEFLSDAMTQTVRRSLAKRLQKRWEHQFRHAFKDTTSPLEDLVTEQNISEAIATYERSQVFVKAPWHEYVAGNLQAISTSAKRGAVLFFNSQESGGAGCVSCHSGDFFTDEEFYNTAMPQIGEGKAKNEQDKNKDDLGCFLVTGKPEDAYRFRTPSLLNVEVTGPWGHSGAYTSLEAVTRHMLDPKQALKHYDSQQLTQPNIDLAQLPSNHAKLLRSDIDVMPSPQNSEQVVQDLVAFMKTLTDPCVKSRECLSPWIPDQNSNDPDRNLLHGLAQSGQRL